MFQPVRMANNCLSMACWRIGSSTPLRDMGAERVISVHLQRMGKARRSAPRV